MTIESEWYANYTSKGPPRRIRLCRQSLDRKWSAAIDLAIAYAEGTAGYRSTGKITLTGEQTWFWPQPEGDWWLIPHRVDRRCFALYQAAIESEIRRGRGRAADAAIAQRLRRWRESGHWRRIAAGVHPRHGTPSSYADVFREPGDRRRKGSAAKGA